MEMDLMAAGIPWETLQRMSVKDVLGKYVTLTWRKETQLKEEEEWLQRAEQKRSSSS